MGEPIGKTLLPQNGRDDDSAYVTPQPFHLADSSPPPNARARTCLESLPMVASPLAHEWVVRTALEVHPPAVPFPEPDGHSGDGLPWTSLVWKVEGGLHQGVRQEAGGAP